MKIVLVIDQFDSGNNGTTVTAQRYAAELRRRGHEVVVLACGEPAEGKIAVSEWHVPLFSKLITSQGMKFAKPEDEAYYQAFLNADIIHFYLPFRFCRRGEEIARQMHIPTIAAFHVQPENITYSIGLGSCKQASDIIYKWYYNVFYNRFTHIHCPSRFIAEQLQTHGYDAKLHVISNGVDNAFIPMQIQRPPEFNEKFVILMVGRLSGEKRQDLIIQAVKCSCYSDKIQLVFAGKGPKELEYRRQSEGLLNSPIFGFYKQKELVELMNSCDLYVHASDAEIEGISCMEAFSCGLVPVISDSQISATKQYALDERSLFCAGNAQSLADRIDYWIEHPNQRKSFGQKYARIGDTIRVDTCVKQAEEMYLEAIHEYHQNGYRRPKQGKIRKLLHPDIDKACFQYYPTSWLRRFVFSFITNLLSILLYFVDTICFGFSIEGRKYIKGICGGISVMNHVHPMDCTMAKIAMFPNKIYFVSLRRNLELPIVGWLVRWFGGIPIPNIPSEMIDFQRQMEDAIGRGELVHFYPEGQLVRYHNNIRKFHRGAFITAVRTGCPIVPMVIAYSKPGYIRSFFKKRPCMRILICEPQYADLSLSHGAAVVELMQRTRRVMEQRLNDISTNTGNQEYLQAKRA